MRWFIQSLIAFDQFINCFLFFGYADETLSARAFRNSKLNDKYWWSVVEILINWLFFWQRNPSHCKRAYNAEYEAKHLPREYRG